MNMDNLISLCAEADVPSDAGFRVDLPGRPPMAVFRLDDTFHVVDDTCTHGLASLSDGYVEDGTVECPLHAGKFCIKTGAPVDGPVDTPVRVYPSQVVNGRVCITNEFLRINE